MNIIRLSFRSPLAEGVSLGDAVRIHLPRLVVLLLAFASFAAAGVLLAWL